MAASPEQRALIDTISGVLAQDERIEALWLAGSLGRGGGDAFSDVDVLALVRKGALGEVTAEFALDVSAIAEPVLVNPLYGGRVLNVVTIDWRRFDITFIEASELVRYDAAHLTTLFNRAGLEPPYSPPRPYSPSPEQLLRLVNEFLRVLGLTVVAMGREEYVLGLNGVELLRRMTVDLMLEENAVAPADRGGALHRNPLLTAEQRRELEAAPPLVATRDSVLANDAALAGNFLPRARRLADRIGMVWPEAFEAATRRHLAANLGLEF